MNNKIWNEKVEKNEYTRELGQVKWWEMSYDMKLQVVSQNHAHTHKQIKMA